MDHRNFAQAMHISIPLRAEPKPDGVAKFQLLIEMEQSIDAYVDQMDVCKEASKLDLLPTAALMEKKKLELKAAAILPELEQQLDKAIELLLTEDVNDFSEIEFSKLRAELAALPAYLQKITLNDLEAKNIQNLVNVSDASMQTIAAVAQKKFTEKLFADCFALFSLLSFLDAENPEYWFRMGIAAEHAGDLAHTVPSYKAAIDADPTHIGAKLLLAACYIQHLQLEDAEAELFQAKQIAERCQVDAMWLDLLPVVQQSLSKARL